MKSTVSIVRCEDYTPDGVRLAVKKAVDLLGGMERFLLPGQRALLKPNLLAAHPPESAICTHPAVVEAVIELVREVDASCAVGDSPCITAETPAGFARMLDATGMAELSSRTGVPIVRFDEEGVECEATDALVFRQLLLARALQDADLLINLPKFKTHGLTMLTGGIKNLYGCVPGRKKLEFHLQAGDRPEMFAQLLVDILRTVRPKLTVMDGIIGMDGQGPSTGRRREFGVVLASADPVALDAVACMVAGIDPMTVPAIRLAGEQGVGVADPGEIEILGARPEEVRIADFQLPASGDLVTRMPKPVYRLMRNLLVRRPVFDRRRCTGCRACVKGCPAGVISGEGTALSVNYAECIRCYCCQEVCPQGAVTLRASRLRRVFEAAIEPLRKVKRLLVRS
ncbi:MAG: DUF362 domain-containing protein [Armatimonadota bacterium]